MHARIGTTYEIITFLIISFRVFPYSILFCLAKVACEFVLYIFLFLFYRCFAFQKCTIVTFVHQN